MPDTSTSLPGAQPQSDPRLDVRTRLTPGNAVAAIILCEGEYLLQLRDDKPEIFFPAHWGCFGGAIDPDEEIKAALVRELDEELSLKIDAGRLRYFSHFSFDLGFAGMPAIWRNFYEIRISRGDALALSLGEGADMRLFAPDSILSGEITLTPYDAFALWLHINQGRLIAA